MFKIEASVAVIVVSLSKAERCEEINSMVMSSMLVEPRGQEGSVGRSIRQPLWYSYKEKRVSCVEVALRRSVELKGPSWRKMIRLQ